MNDKSMARSMTIIMAVVFAVIQTLEGMGVIPPGGFESIATCGKSVAGLLTVFGMRRAIGAGSDCIGINNRNLKTFATTLETTFELAAMAPEGCTLVSESGIKTPENVVRLKEAGAHAILVGESLLREVSPGRAAAHLMGLA